MAHKLIGRKGNKKTVATSAKIIVDDIEAKKMLMEISDKTGDSMKKIIVRLVEKEYNDNGKINNKAD
jgi:hypothetical protein